MSPLLEHDSDANFLGRLIEALTEAFGVEVVAGGSVTLRRRRKQRGLEPDRCYWIANEPRIRGKRRLDLRVDPPPDLAIEVDTTNSSLNRMSIFAALGVPEVWRLDGGALTFHRLGSRRRYTESPMSLAFPQITPADLLRFLALRTTGENAAVQQFRLWLRTLTTGTGASPTP